MIFRILVCKIKVARNKHIFCVETRAQRFTRIKITEPLAYHAADVFYDYPCMFISSLENLSFRSNCRFFSQGYDTAYWL